MSLAAMIDTKLARDQAADSNQVSPPQPVGVSTSVVNQLSLWIPTETITVYVALLALLAPTTASTSFTSRWILFGALTAVTPVVIILLMMAKTKPGGAFSWPFFEMAVAPVAFAAWAFALPDTPLKSIGSYDTKWNTAIIIVATAAITLVANALHKSPSIDQVITKAQGANPASPEA